MADRSLHLAALILLGATVCGEWTWACGDRWGPPACRAVSQGACSVKQDCPPAPLRGKGGGRFHMNRSL